MLSKLHNRPSVLVASVLNYTLPVISASVIYSRSHLRSPGFFFFLFYTRDLSTFYPGMIWELPLDGTLPGFPPSSRSVFALLFLCAHYSGCRISVWIRIKKNRRHPFENFTTGSRDQWLNIKMQYCNWIPIRDKYKMEGEEDLWYLMEEWIYQYTSLPPPLYLLYTAPHKYKETLHMQMSFFLNAFRIAGMEYNLLSF